MRRVLSSRGVRDVGSPAGDFTDSPHFRLHGASGAQRDAAINELEAAYSCFVETLCWRSSGLSFNDDSDAGPYHKMNIMTVANFVADTYMTSPLCEAARTQFGQPEGDTIIELNRVIGDSYQVIVDGTSGSEITIRPGRSSPV